MALEREPGSPRIRGTGLQFADASLQVTLSDGRTITVPLEWFPRLRDATPKQRAVWEWVGDGIGVHWPELDEDISIAGLLTGSRAPRP